MNQFMYRSDLAVDLRHEDGFNRDHQYEKKTFQNILIEKMILHSDDLVYQKKKGCYVSLSFEELYLEEIRKSLIEALEKELKDMIRYLNIGRPERVLICGLGNPKLACDNLGPLLSDQLLVSAHLDEPSCAKVALLIPRVKAQTGLDTFDIIAGTIERFQPDLVIAVDALATKQLSKINHVIQLSTAGIQPGSGVGNHTKGLDSQSLKVPLIALGVPTVVDCASIAYDVLRMLENYFAGQIQRPYEKLKVVKRRIDPLRLERTQREMLFGEIGKLSDEEKRYLLEEVIRPTSLNMIVMDKNTDIETKELAKVIAHALNQVFIGG